MQLTYGPFQALEQQEFKQGNGSFEIEALRFARLLHKLSFERKINFNHIFKFLSARPDNEYWFADNNGNPFAGIIALEYHTKALADSRFEMHKKYDDLRLVLSGETTILLLDKSLLKWGKFNQADDVALSEENCLEALWPRSLQFEKIHTSPANQKIDSVKLTANGLNVGAEAGLLYHIPAGMPHAPGMNPDKLGAFDKVRELVVKYDARKRTTHDWQDKEIGYFISEVKR
ncbi:MAG: YhcH/YjgK/YiaL family protein [Alphaproteobacteria bacterium]|nr:YhcH/YjgK/YiaL family protein [Alphaproteobacteria bacterium]